MKNIALIIAGGIGARTHQDIPKQFIHVHDIPIIVYTMKAFETHPQIDAIEVVCLDGWHEVLWAYAKQFGISKLENIVKGGITGQDSIRNGLFDLAKRHHDDDDIVLIHDSIRPLVSAEIISENIRVCREKGNATTVIPCTSVMLGTEDSIRSDKQISRDKLKITQTPQSFFINELVAVHKEIMNKEFEPSIASCALYIELGRPVFISQGAERNIKITTSEDIEILQALLDSKRPDWLKN